MNLIDKLRKISNEANGITESKKLNEVRRVEKIRTVKAWDFSELEDKIKEELIDRYKRRNKIDSSNSYEDIMRDEIKLQFAKEFSKLNFIDKNEIKKRDGSISYYFNYYGKDGEDKDRFMREALEYSRLPFKVDYSELSSDLVGNEYSIGYGSNKETGKYDHVNIEGSISGYNSFRTMLMRSLYDKTNYPELSKNSKKEIISKISVFEDEVKETYEKLFDYAKDLKSKNTDSISELKALQNKPVIEELSKKWYTVDGKTICDKADAKVVETEALLTEAPVNLQFDDSFDVYRYDELDDNAKERAFNDKKHLANNLYGRRWPELQKQIKEYIIDYASKLGFSDAEVNVRDEDLMVQISGDELLKYAKDNGIEVTPSEEVGYSGSVVTPYALISLKMVDGKYNYRDSKFSVSVRNITNGYKDLQEELKMDFEAIYNNVQRMLKKAHDQADSDYKAKMSKQNKEYLANGKEYKESLQVKEN